MEKSSSNALQLTLHAGEYMVADVSVLSKLVGGIFFWISVQTPDTKFIVLQRMRVFQKLFHLGAGSQHQGKKKDD